MGTDVGRGTCWVARPEPAPGRSEETAGDGVIELVEGAHPPASCGWLLGQCARARRQPLEGLFPSSLFSPQL